MSRWTMQPGHGARLGTVEGFDYTCRVAAYNPSKAQEARRVIDEVLADYKQAG